MRRTRAINRVVIVPTEKSRAAISPTMHNSLSARVYCRLHGHVNSCEQSFSETGREAIFLHEKRDGQQEPCSPPTLGT